jgi:uncharacterized protein (TIGR03437 family)
LEKTLRKLNRLTELLAVAAVVVVGLADTAFGQQLNFNPPNPTQINISGPGSTASSTVTVTSSSTITITSVAVDSIDTSDHTNWLCATASGNVVTISIGAAVTGCGASTNQLVAGRSYTGNIAVHDSGNTNGSSGAIQVNLTVGGSGSTNGLVATPNPLNVSLALNAATTSQNVNITFNGSAATITGVSYSTTTGQNWLSAFNSGFVGTVTVNVNPSAVTTAGLYTGTVTVFTTAGQLNFQVNFTAGGGSTIGLSSNPAQVFFSLPSGSGSSSQSIQITFNGQAVSVNSLFTSTNTGQSWLQAANTGILGTVQVTAIPSLLTTTTSDSGSVLVSTPFGSFSVPVNLTIGGSSSAGLAVNPSVLSLSVPFGSGSSSQNVSVTNNGIPVAIQSVSSSTANTSQNWLLPSNPGITGSVTVTVNPSLLSTGNYTGTVFVTTQFGQVNFTVNLAVGTGGTSGLVATPGSLNFNIPIVGAGTPPQTTTITQNGFAVTIQSITSSVVGQTWLVPSFTGNTVTVGINGANLTQGTYSATLTVTTSGGVVTIPVNVSVATGGGGTTGLVATPNPVVLSVASGTQSTSQNVNITLNGASTNITSVSATTSTGQNWLTATTNQTGVVTVTAFPSTLSTGTYSGTVTVNTTAGSTTFQVNLTVGTSGTTGLSATPNPVTLTAQIGAAPSSQNVNILFNGNPATVTSVSTTTTTGQNWLTAQNLGVSGTVTITVNPSILLAGSYTGTVNVNTTAGTTSFQVNLTVGSTTPANGLTVTPNPITFNESAAGQAGSQTISVTLNGAAQQITGSTFAPTIPGLTFVNTRINSDGTLTLTVNSVVTTPGIYTGTLTLVTATGGQVAVPVTLNFGGSGGGGGLSASPNLVTFSGQSGATLPSQNVNITFNGAAVTILGVSTSTTTGQNWLSASAATGVTGVVTVSVNTGGLQGGTYSGTVTVNTSSGTVTFQVNLTVGTTTPPGPTIILSPVSLAPVSFQVGGAAPTPQIINLSLVGGGTTTFSASASTSSGGSWLSVTPANGTVPGSITVTVNPSGLGAGTYSGSVAINVPLASNSPVTLPITLTVTAPVVTAPFVAAVDNAASGIPTALSPGLNITLVGSNLGPATLALFQLTGNGTLATTVAGTKVEFDGIPSAVIYTSNTQVSVMVPYEVAGRATTSMVLTYNGVASNTLTLRVVNSAPGIYTVTQTGVGQGAILNQNGTLNSATNPETGGNIVQIFATGEGLVSPSGVNGGINPNRLPLPAPNLPVTVNIGGREIPSTDITYAGEAPGLVSGVIQVNARLPVGLPPGPTSVIIRVGGTPSQNNVTVSVR